MNFSTERAAIPLRSFEATHSPCDEYREPRFKFSLMILLSDRLGILGKVVVGLVCCASLICQPFGLAQKAPGWKLPSISGGVVDLEKLRGKVVVVSFGATWCPPCREELPALQEIANRYANKGVEVLWISLDERKVSDQEVRQFAERFGLKVPVLRDYDAGAYSEVGDGPVPLLVIIGREGKIVGKPHMGFSNREVFLTEVGETLDRIISRRAG